MKVGILTFTETTNFGACLQAYALQEAIKSCGHNAEIIKYVNKDIERKEKNIGLNKLSPKGILKEIVMGRGQRRKNAAFKKYEKEHFHVGKQLSQSNRGEYGKYYDKFVTGSDQVWNMRITEKDWTYFLDFVDDSSKKVSYAPSFGNDIFPTDYYEKARELLNEFSSLSVREKSGAELIKKICDKNAEVVLDPTFLLTKDQWIEKTNFTPDIENYILVYFPHNKKNVFDFIDKLKAKTGLPVVYLSISPKIQRGVRTIYDASPDEFVGWIANADYVVTGSFHGTAFSLNLEKQFFYEPSGAGSRIENIVNLFGTSHRAIDNPHVLDNIIDYSVLRDNIQKSRNASFDWLKTALDDKQVVYNAKK